MTSKMYRIIFLILSAAFIGQVANAETVILKTTYGNGADASASESYSTDAGNALGTQMAVTYNGVTGHAIGFVRFDLSQIVPGSITGAELHLFPWRDQTTLEHTVWGLNDGYNGTGTHQGEFWEEDEMFTWSTAPETVVDGDVVRVETFSNSTSLGTFTAPESAGTDFTALSGTNLVNFLNADTNGVVTFIIERISSVGGNYIVYTTKETTDLVYSVQTAEAGTWAPYLELEAQSYAVSNPSVELHADEIDPAGLTLSWDAPSAPGTFTYDVYMSSPSDPTLQLVSSGQGQTTYTPSPELAYGANILLASGQSAEWFDRGRWYRVVVYYRWPCSKSVPG